MSKKLKLTFCSGVGKVTGANFLVESEHTKFLVDCGLVQGEKVGDDENRKPWIYDPKTIDYLFITHAHLDHVGRIPKLVHDGFTGVIYSTPETLDLAALMLEDSLGVLTKEAQKDNLKPLYSMEDVHQTMALWKAIPFHEETKINDEFSLFIKDSGHILGSGMFVFTYNEKKIVFTGDLGNSPTPLLNDTEPITGAHYVVMESVYGDRNHEGIEERQEKLGDVLKKVTTRGGVLMIPIFSLEKTQVVLHEMNALFLKGEIPKVPVYLDSPLAIKVTNVYKKYKKDFKQEVQDEMVGGDDIFDFPMLHKTLHPEESMDILHTSNPKIIIAGSGMSNGGRITRHEKTYLSDPNNAILFLGYQSAGTLGRIISEGAKQVTINGDVVPVRAEVLSISGYSSHKDSDHLVEFAETAKDTLKKAFIVMGEDKAALYLVQRLRDYTGIKAYHPEAGESVVLDC
jgi:metallo-beta-lactamase family protein